MLVPLLFEIVLGMCVYLPIWSSDTFFLYHIFIKNFLSVSGLLSNGEIAQDYASTGVGLLAGSCIFLLTVVWGSCVIAGSQQFEHDSGFGISHSSNSAHKSLKELLNGLLHLTLFEAYIIFIIAIKLHIELY